MAKDEKIENAPSPAEHSRVYRWLDNVWYHYKWVILITLFFALVLIVCLVQCVSREKTDLTVSFAGAATLTEAEQNAFGAALEAVMPEDFDKDGTKAVTLVTNAVFTTEQIREMYSYTDEATGEKRVDSASYNGAMNYNNQRLENISNYLMTGSCAVWIVSPYVYEQANMSKLAVKLSDVYETVPDAAYDDYAVRLSKTGFYRYFDAVKNTIPDDTLIVLIHVVVGETAKQEYYKNSEALFKAIVAFEAP